MFDMIEQLYPTDDETLLDYDLIGFWVEIIDPVTGEVRGRGKVLDIDTMSGLVTVDRQIPNVQDNDALVLAREVCESL